MGRGQGANRIQMILTAEQQAELVRDYLDGMPKLSIMAKWGLPHAPQLYSYLRRNGVQQNRMKPRKRKTLCCVCGNPRPLPAYIPRSEWFTHASCGDPACLSILQVRPDLRPRWAPVRRNCRPVPGRLSWDGDVYDNRLQDENGRLDAAALAALEKAFHLDVDDRGAQLSEQARKAVWSRLARVSIAVRLIAEKAAETTLTLPRRSPLDAFLQRFFGSRDNASAADAFDVIYLWRCSCVYQYTYIVQSLAEFPTEPGSYGVCTYCSSAALEVA